MKINAVLFDMDGVLVDSEKVITKAAINALKEWNIYSSSDDFKPFTGMGEDKFIGGVANLYGRPFLSGMKKRTYEIYLDIVHQEIVLYEGIVELLECLKKKNYLLALASSADLVKVNANLSAAGISSSLFDTIISGDMIKNKKPAPDIFLEAAFRLNVSPLECMVIEDALSGIQAAKSAGMFCTAVLTSFKRDDFHSLNPDFIIERTRDLNTLL